MQSPRTVRTCHSVGTTRSREAGLNSQWTQKIAEIVKNQLGFFATQEDPLAVVPFFPGDIAPCLNHQIFPNSSQKNEEVSSARNFMVCHVNTQMVLLPYHFFFF